MVSMIFRKSMRLSNAARRSYTVGEITNFMSVDAQRLVETFWYVNQLWVGPFLIITSLYFLYLELGLAAFAGAGILVLLVPINAWLGNINKRLQKLQLENKDERIKLMNEVLKGMKVLKLYAWEKPFMGRVDGIRDAEIDNIRTTAKISAFVSLTFACSPFFVTLTLFAVYTALDPTNNILTADKMFVSISLLNILRLPLVMFPWSIVESIKLMVSLNRINKFLNAEELDPDNVDTNLESSENDVEIDNATLSWDEDNDTLKDINLNIKKGSLTAIVGMVGSGKSSLVSAMLGEMHLKTGKVMRQESVAYVPQQAWIQNMSLKDNILFDKPNKPRHYKRAIQACALIDDLAILSIPVLIIKTIKSRKNLLE